MVLAVNCMVLQKRNAGFHANSTCFWDAARDGEWADLGVGVSGWVAWGGLERALTLAAAAALVWAGGWLQEASRSGGRTPR